MKTKFGAFLQSVRDDKGRRFAALGEVQHMIGGWSDDELDVLGVVAERLTLGRAHYGVLDLATDTRDWRTELDEEVADVLVYSAIRHLRRGAP
jgi:hypothetical protein